MRKPSLLLLALVIGLSLNVPSANALRWQWQDRFNNTEKEKLKTWISTTRDSVEALLGPLPRDLNVYLYRHRPAREPTPWAHTSKGYPRGVHFYVDPRFTLQDYLDDWTGPHELIHMYFPYIGEENRWFAEGFASYLQYQAMYQMGILDWPQALRRYEERWQRGSSYRRFENRNLAEAQQDMIDAGQYPRVYWGGAVYFLQVDRELQERHSTRLTTVVADYAACCLRRFGSMERLVQDLDRRSGTNVFSRTLAEFRKDTGFPDYRQHQAWLAASPPRLLETEMKAYGRVGE